MSIFEQAEMASTLRHYSQLSVSFSEIHKLCIEVTSLLNKSTKAGVLEIELIHNLKKTGQLLWDHLFTRAVKERLKETPIKDLILLTDEELISIPWELLYTGDDFLCIKFNLGRVIRTKGKSGPSSYRSFSTMPKMLIMANPTDDLKSAYLEGVYIKNQFDKRRKDISIDFKSTHIDTFFVKKNLRDYDIVHFAGHCEYDKDDPKNSGWVLSNGIFNIQDIYALGETLSLPSLVFSNACHSAKFSDDSLGDDYQERAYSLACAFLFSGVRHYIGTIRKIEDPVSLSFAREFYARLISGSPVGECVRLARLKLIKEYGITTIAWTSYLLYGDPNFVLFRLKAKAAKSKLKKGPILHRRQLAWLSLVVAIISICIYLYIWLPSVNPSTFLLFFRSQKLFLKGQNQAVISLASRIIKDDPLFLSAYPLLADTYQRIGDKESALRCYFDYIRHSEKRKDKKHLVSAYTGLGWTYYLQGDYAKSFDFYNRALVLSQENKDKMNEADVLGKLAVWYMDNDDNDKALELLTKSAEINRERRHIYKHNYNLACDYFNLGLVFSNKKDFTAAKEFYDKSFRIFEKLKLTHELSDYYFNIGEIYAGRKEYLKAMDCYDKGLKIDEKLGNKFNLTSDYGMIAELYVETDNLAEAEKYFNQSIGLSKEINAYPELADAYYNLGLLYKKKNQKNKAKDYLRQAQEIYALIDSNKYQKIKQEFLEFGSD